MINVLDSKKINLQPITPETEKKIRDRIVELSHPKEEPRYCVDGRTGEREDAQKLPMETKPYGQALGGDLNIASVRWLLDGGQENFLETVSTTFADLSEAGYKQLGVHYGGHHAEQGSDCGFADNNARIIETLAKKAEEIWKMIQEAIQNYPNIQLSEERFMKLITEKVQQASLSQLPSGKQIIDHAATLDNVTVQMLEEDHKEVAAVVNLRPNTTLDADNNQDEAQAFNLDLWLVQQQAADLGIDVNDATLLTLGLYVATEMVLVEERRQVRLPILINQ